MNDKHTSALWMELHLSRNKLKTTNKVSALLAGFAMIVLIDVSIENYQTIQGFQHNVTLTLYGLLTVLLIFVHIYSLMISTNLLPDLEYIANYEKDPELSDFLIQSSPHRRFSTYLNVSSFFSNVLGNYCSTYN